MCYLSSMMWELIDIWFNFNLLWSSIMCHLCIILWLPVRDNLNGNHQSQWKIFENILWNITNSTKHCYGSQYWYDKFVNMFTITMGNKACFHTPTSMAFYQLQAHIGNHLPYFEGQITWNFHESVVGTQSNL